MYVRIDRARIDPAKINEATSNVGQDLAAAVRQQPGCQSFMGGANRATGEAITISTWDTEEHASFSADTLGFRSRLEALGTELGGGPEVFEVTVT
jgi:quinol monooxygenase YgiN